MSAVYQVHRCSEVFFLIDRKTLVRSNGIVDQLYGIERAAALLGVHPDTIRRWEQQGKIRILRTPGGKRRIPELEIRRLRGEGQESRQRVLAIYGRVSSHEQKTRGDLDRQVAHIRAAMTEQRFDRIIEMTDVASGLSDRRKEQVLASLGDAVADIVAWARGAGKPVVVERLDFRAKKARLREASDRYARKLSPFAYAGFYALLVSRAAREGVEVLPIHPAYTSGMGKVKFLARYGLSPHGAAAVAIARRGLGFGERLRSGNALPLPVRNRGRHVWSDWGWVLPSVRGQKPTHALSQRPSEGDPGRGQPLSAPAPVGADPHGPGRDGLAWVPGCDPPARTVGSTVRPAL